MQFRLIDDYFNISLLGKMAHSTFKVTQIHSILKYTHNHQKQHGGTRNCNRYSVTNQHDFNTAV